MKTSAVPPRLTHSAHSPVCHHTPSPLTAGYRQPYSPFGFQTTLTSPFRIVLRYCPFTTGQLSGNAVSFLLTLALRFSCSTVTKYNTRIRSCQAPFNIFPLWRTAACFVRVSGTSAAGRVRVWEYATSRSPAQAPEHLPALRGR